MRVSEQAVEGAVTRAQGAFLERRREQIAQRRADAPLFRPVFTVSCDEAVEACKVVVDALGEVASSGRLEDVAAAGFDSVREQLGRIVASRARRGVSTARIAHEAAGLPAATAELRRGEDLPDHDAQEALLALTLLMGTLRLMITETTVLAGEELIGRRRRQLLEVANPAINLWEGVVAIPMIGTSDSACSQVVMESLLQAVVRGGSADGRRVHRLRHPPGHRADDRAPGHRPEPGPHTQLAGRRPGVRARPAGHRGPPTYGRCDTAMTTRLPGGPAAVRLPAPEDTFPAFRGRRLVPQGCE